MPGPDSQGRLADAARPVDQSTPGAGLGRNSLGNGGQLLGATEEKRLLREIGAGRRGREWIKGGQVFFFSIQLFQKA